MTQPQLITDRASVQEYPRVNGSKYLLIGLVNLPIAAMTAWLAIDPRYLDGQCTRTSRKLTCEILGAIFTRFPGWAQNAFFAMFFFLLLAGCIFMISEGFSRKPIFLIGPYGIGGRLGRSGRWFVPWTDLTSIAVRPYGIELKATKAATVPWWIWPMKGGYTLSVATRDVGLTPDELYALVQQYRPGP